MATTHATSTPMPNHNPDDASSIAPSYYSDSTLPGLSTVSSPTSAPAYTDDTITSVTLDAADLESSDDEEFNTNIKATPEAQPRRKSFLDRLRSGQGKDKDKGKAKGKGKGKHIVMMTRGDYLRYWARDAKSGAYIGTEPEGTGRRLLKQRRLAQHAPGQFQTPGERQSGTVGTGASHGSKVPTSQHHGEGKTVVGVGGVKSQRVEDKFAMVEGTMPQAVGYGSYLPQGAGFGKVNLQKRMLEGVDLQRR